MGFFKQIEGEAAILVENGVYKQVDLFERDGYLFAKAAGGFVRLMADGSTTKARMRIDTMSFEGALFKDALGRLCSGSVPNARPLEAPIKQKLLGIASS